MQISIAPPKAIATRMGWSAWPVLLTLVLVGMTSLPYLFAAWTVPVGLVYTGLMLDAQDTLQYFAWLRDHRSALLIPNRMTSQPNEPALFNLLWLALAYIQNLTGWSNGAIFQVLRLLGGFSFAWAVWWFFGLTAPSQRDRLWAWILAMFGGGLGVVWVFEKYALGLPDVRYPFDLYVAEPNTFLSVLGYPHFLVAGALVVAIFAATLLAAKGGRRWWWAAAGFALLLGLQHAYDLLTVYTVFGGWLVLLTVKRRAIPWPLVRGMLLVGLVSFPPAGYFALLTTSDPIWREILSQFSNAGVWTPNLPHLFVLVGLPLVVTLLTVRSFRSLQACSDNELLVWVWAAAGLGLVYLPVNFQIHLLNPWQVPLALLAIVGVQRIVAPWVERRRAGTSRWLPVLLVVLALPTNVYLFTWRYVELSRYQSPYFLEADEVAALGWLEANASGEDVVASDLEFGQFVPADSDARAALSHWAMTLDFFATQDAMRQALDPATGSAERGAILRSFNTTLLVARAALDDSELRPLWSGKTLVIYRVQSN